MTEKQTESTDIHESARASADRIMGSRPRSLFDALKQDWNSLLPQSEIAAERRERAKRVGKRILVAAGVTAAAFGLLKLDEATQQPVGSLFSVIGQGDTVDANFSDTITELENRTNMDLSDNVLRTPESDAKGDLLDQIADENGVYQPASYTVEVSKGGILGLPYIDVDTSTEPNTHIDPPKD